MGRRCDSDEGVDLHLGDPALHLHGRQRAQEDSWDKRPSCKASISDAAQTREPRFYGAHKAAEDQLVGELAILGFHVTGLVASKPRAARFLDRSLGAKDRFLTLATVERTASLLPVVESSATAIAASAAGLPLPPRRKQPLVASVALSAAGLLFLWVIPELTSLAGAGGGGLDRIAAELAAGDAADRELAQVLRDVSKTLHDPRRSKEEKRAKIAEALAKLDQAERKRQISAAGSSGGAGEKGDQEGPQQQADGKRQDRGAGAQGSGQEKQQQAGGAGNGEGSSRPGQAGAEDSWDKRPTDVKPQYPTLPKHETPRFYGCFNGWRRRGYVRARSSRRRSLRAARAPRTLGF